MSQHKIISTFPSIIIELNDGVQVEILDKHMSFYARGDTPGMADPLNEYELESMYTVEEI